MRIAAALGGNPLLRRGDSAITALAPLLRRQVVLTHGNGPQAGVLALESAADRELSRPHPFDVLRAQAQRTC